MHLRPWPRKAPPIECFILSIGLLRTLNVVLSTNVDLGGGLGVGYNMTSCGIGASETRKAWSVGERGVEVADAKSPDSKATTSIKRMQE